MTKDQREAMQYGLGAGVVLAFFLAVVLLFTFEIPVVNKDAAMLTLGSLGTMAGAVVGYFYGSSKGSSEKTELLGNGGSNGQGPK